MTRRRILYLLLPLAIAGGMAWRFQERPRYRNGIRYDPIEDDERVQQAIRIAEREAHEAHSDKQGQRGFCHAVWQSKKKILRDKYRIEWRTPAEMNPETNFD